MLLFCFGQPAVLSDFTKNKISFLPSTMSDNESSTSESEVSACSSNYNPMKALYSEKTVIPVSNAPMFENIQQLVASQKNKEILPVGQGNLVQERERKKRSIKEEQEKALEEKNKQRFAKYGGMVPTKISKKRTKNVLTRMDAMVGPLAALKECVQQRLRIKVVTRRGHELRGVLQGTLVAFDKQWNLAMADVLETWTKKAPRKRKVPPPSTGTAVPSGTASKISPVPVVTEKPLGKGLWECTRHVPQLMVRGEHVVIVNLVER